MVVVATVRGELEALVEHVVIYGKYLFPFIDYNAYKLRGWDRHIGQLDL